MSSLSIPHLSATGAIILAAGSATRMGEPKQILPYLDGTLLSHAVEQARSAGFEPIALVLGAYAEQIREATELTGIEVVLNDAWQCGMGSSVAAGMQLFPAGNQREPSAIAVLLADQPLVRAEHLIRMRQQLEQEPETQVMAASYGGTLGVPALFRRETFPLLRTLPPESGARHLLRDSNLIVNTFPLAEAAMDIDTPTDFEALASRKV